MRTILVATLCLMSSFYSSTMNDPINPERQALLNKVFQTLEQHVPNKKWLDKSYKKFKKDMYSRKVMKMEDKAFLSYFKERRQTLSFSHFDLHSKSFIQGIQKTEKEQAKISWKAVNAETAYLRVRTFVMDAQPMIKAVSEIGTHKFKNLIIDLRGNGGGNLEAPIVLGRFLTQKPIDGGIYLTKSWFEKYARSATKDDIEKMPFLQDFTFEGIHKMYQSSDAFRMVIPPHNQPTFQGKVYIIINGSTASASEPLIDLLQKEKIATLVGQTSAGNMLSGQTFKINDTYEAFLPIADYQTAQGKRIDQVGVSPDLTIDPNKAFNYILKELIK